MCTPRHIARQLYILPKDICAFMFIDELLIITNNWNKLSFSSIDEWILKDWHFIYRHIYMYIQAHTHSLFHSKYLKYSPHKIGREWTYLKKELNVCKK